MNPNPLITLSEALTLLGILAMLTVAVALELLR